MDQSCQSEDSGHITNTHRRCLLCVIVDQRPAAGFFKKTCPFFLPCGITQGTDTFLWSLLLSRGVRVSYTHNNNSRPVCSQDLLLPPELVFPRSQILCIRKRGCNNNTSPMGWTGVVSQRLAVTSPTHTGVFYSLCDLNKRPHIISVQKNIVNLRF